MSELNTPDTPPWDVDEASPLPLPATSAPLPLALAGKTSEPLTPSAARGDVMSYFPLPTPRKSQEVVLRETVKAFQTHRIVILEAPVGSGKSPIAVTLAKYFGSAHILTPRKGLQDQYFDDFSSDIALMKGRNAYPCTKGEPVKFYNSVISAIKNGKSLTVKQGDTSCATAPCKDSKTIFDLCTNDRDCPYTVALEVAQNNDIVVHNIHSFVFQTMYGGKFVQRPLMILDEVHDLEGALRDFITKTFSLPGEVSAADAPAKGAKPDEWFAFLAQDKFLPDLTIGDEGFAGAKRRTAPKDVVEGIESSEEDGGGNEDEPVKAAAKGTKDPKKLTPRQQYLLRVSEITEGLSSNGNFVVKISHKTAWASSRVLSTDIEFVPEFLGDAAENLILRYGEKSLLMSGTIYDKAAFCKNLGIKESDAYFIRIPSSFPVSNRPIYCKPDYQVDTSHAKWESNFEEMILIMRKIMGIFHNVKGLVHAPSYFAAEQIVKALGSDRVVSHGRQDFTSQLEWFYAAKGAQVFVSPICQQGVDFKEDRARFQIVTRVPYPNAGDPFVEHKLQNDFSWYNHQALVVLGQQVGRVNRSEKDFGATFLLDSRFNQFLSKNRGKLPKWLLDAVVQK
jgi:ATP-dependent DNA helicase DinG